MVGAVWPEASFAAKLAVAAVYGVMQALPLLHTMHDASHTAIGHSEGWWKAVGRGCLDWFGGASMMSWHHQHVVGHHIYTNVFEVDPDLPAQRHGDLRMIVPAQVWQAVYRWQHVYLPIVYGLLSLKFRLQDITDLAIARTNGAIRVNEYDNFWIRIGLTKVVWAAWRILVPLFVFQVPAAQFWTMFLVSELTSGYWLAFNFQVSHISTDIDWPNGKPGAPVTQLPDNWAIAQVKTSLDYAHDSTLQTFLCGALNYQIEHHLFPSVSQYHYPALAPIVKQTCKEFNVPYRYEPTFSKALMAHFRHLWEMGQAGKQAHLD